MAKYKLLGGEWTNDVDLYISRWEYIGHRLCELFQSHLIGYDPDFLLSFGAKSFTIPGAKALVLVKEVDKHLPWDNQDETS